MLIESGFVYCCLWVCPPTSRSVEKGFTCAALSQIFYLISAFHVLPKPGVFIVMDAVLVFLPVRCVLSVNKFSWVLKYTDLAQGLYPTLIVIIVGMQMSPVEYHSTHSAGGMRDPGLVPPSTSQHVDMIDREYVSDSDTQVPSAVL